MTINLDTLRTTVENAGEAWADGEHVDIITPAVVLALIAEIESLRTRFSTMRAGRDSERSRADVNANALERMAQRALGAEANVEAALEVSRARLTNIEQAERRASQAVADCKAAEQAVARVRELGDAWKSRGEHSMKYSETLQWPVAEAIHDGGADMVNNANLIYRALDGDSNE